MSYRGRIHRRNADSATPAACRPEHFHGSDQCRPHSDPRKSASSASSAFLFFLLLTSPLHTQEIPRAADSLLRLHPELFETPDDTVEPIDRFVHGRIPLPRFQPAWSQIDLLALADDHFFIEYDRADELYVGVGTTTPVKDFLAPRMRAHATIGYSVGSHFWQVRAGVAQDFLSERMPLRLALEGHVFTDTRDAWKMGPLENTLFALFAGIDTRDYYKRSGFSIAVTGHLAPRVSVTGAYQGDEYEQLESRATWALFGRPEPFEGSITVGEGWLTSMSATLLVDYMSMRGWRQGKFGLEARVETGIGAADFSHYLLDARAKWQTPLSILAVAGRLRLGSATGQAPPQRQFSIGGFGTLAGYPQNDYTGNRMALIQSDILVAPLPEHLPGLRFILSNDFGVVGTAGESRAFLEKFPSPENWLYSPGIHVGTATGTIRAGLAWRTDVGSDPRVVVRLSQRF